jgi:hypothetical protein
MPAEALLLCLASIPIIVVQQIHVIYVHGLAAYLQVSEMYEIVDGESAAQVINSD